jgi:hypothetical protein
LLHIKEVLSEVNALGVSDLTFSKVIAFKDTKTVTLLIVPFIRSSTVYGCYLKTSTAQRIVSAA